MLNDRPGIAEPQRPARRSRRAIEIAVIVLAIAGVSLLLLVRRGEQGPASSKAGDPSTRGCAVSGIISEGERIPADCVIESLSDGRPVRLKEAQAGKPLIINFWASWCVYCIKEMPDFQRVYEQAGDRVSFLGLDLLNIQGETRSAAVKLANETGVRYPLGYDEGALLYAGLTPRLLMPTTIFVHANGTVAYRQFGPLTERELRDRIRQYLRIELSG